MSWRVWLREAIGIQQWLYMCSSSVFGQTSSSRVGPMSSLYDDDKVTSERASEQRDKDGLR